MRQDLTTTSSSLTITRKEVEAKIEALHGRLEPHPVHPTRYCVPRDKAVTTAEHRQLCAVRERLERELQPCTNRNHIEAVINRLLIGFDLGNGPADANREALDSEFIEACAGLPLFAIVAAAARFRSAETLLPWNPDYRPKPGQFAKEAREGMIPTRTKLIHVRRVLDAEVYAPPTREQQDAVAAAAKAYVDERERIRNEEAGAFRPAAGEIAAAREAELRDSVSKLRAIGSGPDMGRLMANLDRRQAEAGRGDAGARV